MSGKKYRVSTIEKALDIFEYLSKNPDGISLKNLSTEIGKSSNEIYRVFNTLLHSGYLLKIEKTNTVQLSSKLFRLAHYLPPYQTILDAVSEPMAYLSEATGLSSYISILDKKNVLNLYEQEGTRTNIIHTKLGSRFPAIERNSGKLLVALLDEKRFSEFLEHDFYFQSLSQEKKGKVLQELKSFGKRAYLIKPSHILPGVYDAIVPLGENGEHFRAALTVPYFKKLVEKETLIQKMLETAHQINLNFGNKDGDKGRIDDGR
ncbi:MAG: helix-turn-helix domain-containing protein [SAR324 cluster bacterium]|nr:helix-turn-helix domain-containing protein [SAR324 cluster bacterium]